MSINNRVKQVIAIKLGIQHRDVLFDQSLSDDLGIDSLVFVEMVIELEREFGIEIDDHDAGDVVTVRDVVGLVKSGLDDIEDRKKAA